MTRVTLTTELACASGLDASNASMRANGRSAWNEDDRDAAASKTNRLLLQVPFEDGGLKGLLLTPKMRADLGLDL